MLRTWLSSLLRPHGAGFFLLPPAHLSPLALRPVRGQCWLFAGFGPVATTFGGAEVERVGGRCVIGAKRVGNWRRGGVGAAEKPVEISGGFGGWA